MTRDNLFQRHWMILTVVLLAVGGSLFFYFHGRRFAFDEKKFVLAKGRNESFPDFQAPLFKNLPWWQQTKLALGFEYRKQFPKYNPMGSSFGPHKTTLCSIQGLLNQCSNVTGVQYIVEKNVVAGSIHFGNPTTLNGKQWVEAFEAALQTEQAEWLEFPGGLPRKEGLVLIRLDKKFTLVVPKEKALAYQKTK